MWGEDMKKYILKYKWLFGLTCFFEVVTAVVIVSCAFVLQYIIDLTVEGDMKKFINGIVFFLIYCGINVVTDTVLLATKTNYIKKTMIYIKKDIFSNIMRKDIKSFSEENSAKYISILSNDVNMIEQDGINTIFNLVRNSFSFIIAVISVIYINVPITIIIAVMGAMAFTLPQKFSKRISEKRAGYSNSLEEFTAKVKDILTGFEVIKSFNILNKIDKVYLDSNIKVEKNKQKYTIYSGMVDILASTLGLLVFTAPLAVGGYFVIKKQITMGTMIALMQLMNNIISPIQTSTQNINKIKSLKPIIEKTDKITSNDEGQQVNYTLDSFQNSIDISNVNFSYDGEKKALKDINVTFEKGKKYALVGGSGCGKSTLLRLLLRYYENFDGNILIDGKEHRNIDINDIYMHLSVIQQNVFMFDGTIRDNIGLYGDYSDDEIIRAANMAGLSKLISKLPKGIYGDAGENGSRLSGGEKQRIAIARALMKKSSIMLLDESTSALDNETAYSIETSLLDLEGITSIVITHKLMEEILKKYDEIIVMRDGTIVERGRFDELIEEKGYFYSLYNVGKALDGEASEKALVG